MKLEALKILTVCLVLLTGSNVKAQTDDLKLGDPAPPIAAYAWIKGNPITEFKKGIPYVVEFGATWCKPCVKAIPELTALAKKYEGQAEVVGLFVKELNHEPLGTQNPKYVENVKRYVERQGDKMMYTVGVDGPKKTVENEWIKAMGKGGGIPQTFVIDKEGMIAAHFKGAGMDRVENLLASIIDGTYKLTNQINDLKKSNAKEIKFDRFKPLYIDGNGGVGDDFIFRSVLTKFKGDIKGGVTPFIDSYKRFSMDRWIQIADKTPEGKAHRQKYVQHQGMVQQVNISLTQLYQLAYSDTLYNAPSMRNQVAGIYYDTLKFPEFKRAYGKYWHEPMLEVSDMEPFISPEAKYNYVLNVPKEKASAYFLQKAMQRDLETYFGYQVTLETRMMPCWFLKAHPDAHKKLQTKTPGSRYQFPNYSAGEYLTVRNADIRDLIYLLYSSFQYEYDKSGKVIKKLNTVFIDRTGIKQEIDYEISPKEYGYFEGGDIESVQQYLKKLGLYLEKGEKAMKVVVISDPKSL